MLYKITKYSTAILSSAYSVATLFSKCVYYDLYGYNSDITGVIGAIASAQGCANKIICFLSFRSTLPLALTGGSNGLQCD